MRRSTYSPTPRSAASWASRSSSLKANWCCRLRLQRRLRTALLLRLPRLLQQVVCFTLVAFGLVFFRAATLGDGLALLSALGDWQTAGYLPLLHGRFGLEHLVFAASFVVVFGCKNSWQVLPRPSAGKTALLLLLLLVTLGFLLGSTNHPFLYFQF